jgi:hypothetical protein
MQNLPKIRTFENPKSLDYFLSCKRIKSFASLKRIFFRLTSFLSLTSMDSTCLSGFWWNLTPPSSSGECCHLQWSHNRWEEECLVSTVLSVSLPRYSVVCFTYRDAKKVEISEWEQEIAWHSLCTSTPSWILHLIMFNFTLAWLFPWLFSLLAFIFVSVMLLYDCWREQKEFPGILSWKCRCCFRSNPVSVERCTQKNRESSSFFTTLYSTLSFSLKMHWMEFKSNECSRSRRQREWRVENVV